jgi:hypothetical protein
VVGQFDSRGSIAIWPYVQYAKSGDPFAGDLLAARLRDYAPGKYVPPRGR